MLRFSPRPPAVERLAAASFSRDGQFAPAFHRVHRIQEKVQENLRHLISVRPNRIDWCVHFPGDFDLLLIQPMLHKLERFLQYFVHVHRPQQWLGRAGEP